MKSKLNGIVLGSILAVLIVGGIGTAYAESFQTVYVEENNQVYAIGDLPDGTNAIWLLGPIQGGVHESYFFEDRAWLSGVNMSTRDSIPDGWGGYSSSAQLPDGVYEWVATSNSLTNGKPTISNILEFSTSVTVVASSQTTPEPTPEIQELEIIVTDTQWKAISWEPDHAYYGKTFFNGVLAGTNGEVYVDGGNGNVWRNHYVNLGEGDYIWKIYETSAFEKQILELSWTVTVEPIPVPEPETSKMTVCHNGQELLVKDKAVRAHVAHGDAVGNCPYEEPKPVQIQVPEPEVELIIEPTTSVEPTTNWEQKYHEALSMLNTAADKLGETEQKLDQSRDSLREQIKENQTLKDKIDNLNQLVLEQAKIIYKWVIAQ